MSGNNTEFVSDMLKKLAKLNYIKPGDVPNIDLYMDQVTTFMDEHLKDSKRHPDDKILTKTMINNYTKNDLLPAPVKKKYSSDHIYILAFIYYFKSILSINDIQTILNPLTEKFFEENDSIDLDGIYKEVYSMCKSQIGTLSEDVFAKAELANESYKGLEDSDNKDFLQFFSLISMLSFDVFLKKNIIETLIDDFSKRTTKEPLSKAERKAEKKAEKMAEKMSEKKTDK